MKHLFVTFSLVATLMAANLTSASAQQSRQQRLRQHLYYLASDSLQGRLAGSEGGAKARHYIFNQYKEIGLQPYSGNGLYPFRPETSMRAMMIGEDSLCNIIMVIPGNDPQLKDEYIVLGAHYDHVGVKGDSIYNGADDNASGSTALIEIARELYAHRNEFKRSVVIAAFDGEEEGLFGSKEMVKMLNADIEKVKVMMSIDMVGWLSTNDALVMEGSSTLTDGKEIMRKLAEEQGLRVKFKRFENSVLTATDTEPFAKMHRPTLAVTTGLKSPYHKPGDDADLIDYEGMDRICSYISELTLRWATDKEKLEPSGKVAPKHEDRRPFFEIGPMAGFGTSGLRYPGSALRGKNFFSANVGVDTRFNFGKFSLQAEAMFNIADMPKANLDGTVFDVFDGRSEEYQKSLIVPVSLVWNAIQTGEFYIGAGINYRRLLNYTDIYQNNLWGVHWTFGTRMGRLGFSYMMLYQLDSYFNDPAMPDMTSLQRWFTVSYLL